MRSTKNMTRRDIRRAALERQIGAISLRIAKQQVLAVPFVNSLAVQTKANDKIKPLAARLKPLQEELRRLEAEGQVRL